MFAVYSRSLCWQFYWLGGRAGGNKTRWLIWCSGVRGRVHEWWRRRVYTNLGARSMREGEREGEEKDGGTKTYVDLKRDLHSRHVINYPIIFEQIVFSFVTFDCHVLSSTIHKPCSKILSNLQSHVLHHWTIWHTIYRRLQSIFK